MDLFACEDIDTPPCANCRGESTTYLRTSAGTVKEYCSECAKEALRFHDEDPTDDHPKVIPNCGRCNRLTFARDSKGGYCMACIEDQRNSNR